MRILATAFLLASTAAALTVPAAAESYFFRTKPLVDRQEAFSFSPASGATPGAKVESPVVRLQGYAGKAVSVSGGEYQVCSASSCSDQGTTWKSAPSTVPGNDVYGRVRLTASAFEQVASATLTAGANSAAFSATSRARDTTPDPVTFANVDSQASGTAALSAVRQLSGHEGISVSVSGTGADMRICTESDCSDKGAGGWAITAADVSVGSYVQLRVVAGTAPEKRTATLSYGTATATWDVTASAGAYAFSSHTFTTCGIEGRDGPSQLQCRSSYDTTWDETDTNYSVSEGIQKWVVPATGQYRITAAGARGGGSAGEASCWGRGAVISDIVTLTQGTVISILVGQTSTGNPGNTSRGGGGGTFVAIGSTPLVVAGGGAGCVNALTSDATNDGSYATTNGAGYGGNGQGGLVNATGSWAGGGGGFQGDGASPANGNVGIASSEAAGRSFANGGRGGRSYYTQTAGGFGGGGGHLNDGGSISGGGGGYTGGHGGYVGTNINRGSGGSSFSSGSTRVNVGYNMGLGYATIEKL